MSYQRKIAADLMKCGASRVRILDKKAFEEAITRQDIRSLIKKGGVVKLQKKGTSKGNVKYLQGQKKLGRRKSRGSRKGTKGARNPRKQRWINTVRPTRRLLKELRETGRIEKENYREIYLKIKGGMFRNKKHLLLYLKEKELLKHPQKKATKGKKTK